MPGLGTAFGATYIVLLAGSIVLLFFVVLSGSRDATPLNKIYFLQADTSGIPGSNRTLSQWTYFFVCGADNTDCGKAVPDLPLGYAWIGGTDGVPAGLTGSFGKHTTSKYYYYMWRFGWVFYLLALVFDVIGFFTSLVSASGSFMAALSGGIIATALFWMTLAASLMSATFIKARNEFLGAGISAKIGEYAFGFTWAAWACMFLATILVFMNCCFGDRLGRNSRRSTIFRRNHSKRSTRHSFLDSDAQRRVKDEYS